jgi:hypothetical protein
MQRLTIITSAAPALALVGCLGNPVVVGVGDDGDDLGTGGGTADDDGDDGASNGDDGVPEESGDDADGSADDGSDGDDTGTAPACAEIDAFGATHAATLTPSQYDATVRDLTGAAGPFAAGTSEDQSIGLFGGGMEVSVAAALAPEVAAAVDLDALLPCDTNMNDDVAEQECFDAFVPAFARLAWRRPVTTGDLDAQAAAFAGNEAFAARMRDVIASVLADDAFIVLSRAGTPDTNDAGLIALDAHALATRLAMFLWNSGPDQTLLDLADSGELLEPDVLHAQAERLLADVRAARMVDDFHTQWLGLESLEEVAKDPVIFPEYDAELAADMLRGTLAFARSIVLGGSGRLRDLFTQPSSFANARLAAIYGDDIVGPLPAGAALEAVMLDPARRGGLLSEPSFATRHSRPDQIGFSRRGKATLDGLLCTPVPPPPLGIDMDVPPPPHDASHKDMQASLMSGVTCVGCHVLMDPVSYALDNYDAIGRWTDTIDGFPVDPSGSVLGQPYATREEMIEIVLASEEFPGCVVDQYARYALDRFLGEDDMCTRDSLVQALVDSDGNVRVLALALVDSDAFRFARLP